MITQQSPLSVCSSGVIHLDNLIKATLNQFNEEINLTAEAFYSPTEYDHADAVGNDRIFTSIERTWIGIFNNALIKANSSIATLQEFCVWDDTRLVGRCDLIFKVADAQISYNVIVEAKNYEFNASWKLTERRNNYPGIFEQAYKYYEPEQKYYHKPVYLMAILFEWIRNQNTLIDVKNRLSEWNDQDNIETNFLTLYSGSTRGLLVYGKLLSIDDYKQQLSSGQLLTRYQW